VSEVEIDLAADGAGHQSVLREERHEIGVRPFDICRQMYRTIRS
jgi:hypothetical protein